MNTEIYPVVHINEPAEAVGQSQLALDSGADGIYLIDHRSAENDRLFGVFSEVVRRNPDAFIGLNLLPTPVAGLALSEIEAALTHGDINRLPDGLWFDDARLMPELIALAIERSPRLSRIRLLGGAAFKYTKHYTDSPDEAADEAATVRQYVDVVTTSGQGTGKPPGPQKIRAMKQTIGSEPLAVASGISAENLSDYRGAVDQLLVSTSIEVEPYSGVFDAAKLRELIELAHQL